MSVPQPVSMLRDRWKMKTLRSNLNSTLCLRSRSDRAGIYLPTTDDREVEPVVLLGVLIFHFGANA